MIRHCFFILFALLVLSCNTSQPTAQTVAKQITTEPGTAPKNLILLIGDGMGLTQISAGMYLNDNYTHLERCPVVGLQKTFASDNLVTDSAASATAIACGVKTYNGAIAVDVNGKKVKTILEEAEDKGLATGLVSSSTIVHATPASFIAHNESRRNYEAIAADFVNTQIDIFIGGGKSYFDRRADDRNLYEELALRNYYVTDYFSSDLKKVKIPMGSNFGFLTSDKDPIPVSKGRDYLIDAADFAVDFLKDRSEEGFFLMVEGSQIDWGGHANDIDYVTSEFLEYNKIIGNILDFAAADGETLVVITADHETGGLAINPGSNEEKIEAAFTTDKHTATMVPIFAFGPGAENFAGIYDNTQIYHKMRKALAW